MATDYRIMAGVVKSNPMYQTERYTTKSGEEREYLSSIIRIGVIKWTPEKGRLQHTYAIQAIRNAADKAKEINIKKGDEIWAVVEGQPTGEGEVFGVIRDMIGRVGDEGLNFHVLIGAVEDGKLDYVGDSGTELTKMSVRVPEKAFNQSFDYYNRFIRTQAWRKTAETAAHLLPDDDSDERRWALVAGGTVNRKWQNKDGEDQWSMTTTVNQIGFLNTKTKKHSREVEDSGISVGESETRGYRPPPDDEDLPF